MYVGNGISALVEHFVRCLEPNEIKLIVDTMNGSILLEEQHGGAVAKSMLIHHLSEYVLAEGYGKKWDVDWKALRAKLENLEEWQAVAICAWGMGFWDGVGSAQSWAEPCEA